MNIIYDLYRILNKKFIFTLLCCIILIIYNYYIFVHLCDIYYISYLYSFESRNFIEMLCILLYYVSILIPIYTYIKVECSSYSYSIFTRISSHRYVIKKCITLILYSLIMSILSLLILLLAILIFKQEFNENLLIIFFNMFKAIFLVVFSTFTLCICIKDISKSEIISVIIISFIIITNTNYNILNKINLMYGFIIIFEILLTNSFIKDNKLGIKKGD